MEPADKHSQQIQTLLSLWQVSVTQGTAERQKCDGSSVPVFPQLLTSTVWTNFRGEQGEAVFTYQQHRRAKPALLCRVFTL